MKKLLLFIFLLFSFYGWAQTQTDMVFLTNGKIIKDCKIYEVEKQKVCYYQGASYFEAEAKAYVKGGVFCSLEAENRYFKTQLSQLPDSIKELTYNNKPYEFYYKKHHQALVARNVGIGFVTAGVLSGSLGLYLARSNESNDPYSSGFTNRQIYGAGLMIMGGISLGIGMPLLIVGQSQKSYYRGKMKKMFPNQLVVNTGVTNNGVGLTLKF